MGRLLGHNFFPSFSVWLFKCTLADSKTRNRRRRRGRRRRRREMIFSSFSALFFFVSFDFLFLFVCLFFGVWKNIIIPSSSPSPQACLIFLLLMISVNVVN